MLARCHWNGKMKFTATVGTHEVSMDAKAPIGDSTAPSPKELVLAAICGCTAMDVSALLRKAKQNPEAFDVDASAELVEGHPTVFRKVELRYRTKGTVDPEAMVDAVRRSMSTYCAVSAMISKSCPVSYTIEHDGLLIASGEANFTK